MVGWRTKHTQNATRHASPPHKNLAYKSVRRTDGKIYPVLLPPCTPDAVFLLLPSTPRTAALALSRNALTPIGLHAALVAVVPLLPPLLPCPLLAMPPGGFHGKPVGAFFPVLLPAAAVAEALPSPLVLPPGAAAVVPYTSRVSRSIAVSIDLRSSYHLVREVPGACVRAHASAVFCHEGTAAVVLRTAALRWDFGAESFAKHGRRQSSDENKGDWSL